MKFFTKAAFVFLFVFSFFSTAHRVRGASSELDQNVTPYLITATDAIKPDESFEVYILLHLEKGWHVYWRIPGGVGFPPSMKWDLPQGWSASVLEFSLPQQFTGPDGKPFYGYEKQALLRVHITPKGDLTKKNSWKIGGTLSWLACNAASCVPGRAFLSTSIGESVSPEIKNQFLKIEKEFVPDDAFLKPHSLDKPTVTSSDTHIVNNQTLTPNFFLLLLALASGMLGGFILNLMPCVLPVISLKIFGFISQAGESRSNIMRHGLAFVAGIYVWFVMLGVLVLFLKAAGNQVTWAFQFQSPPFLVALSLLVFAFALHLFGVFEIALPGKTSSSLDRIASQSGYRGSFFQGLFATLLATPCTAPFLGSALGFAFAQSGSVIMAMFVAIATGMAFPYLLLSMRPGWMKWLPRPGAWMERVKQLMGFPLLATNLWLLSVLSTMRGMQSLLMMLVLLLLLGFSCWIYGSCFSLRPLVRTLLVSLSFLLVGIASWYLIPKIVTLPTALASVNQLSRTSDAAVVEDKINWVPYSAMRLEKLRCAGKAVFLDFTAAWCLTCQFNERTAIDTHAVKELLQTKSIVPMKADWTNPNPEITDALKSFGRVGVPFYVFYPASQSGIESKPITFSELLTESQLLKVFSTN
ncbi:MAG: thioredoxin family protein [Chthoniobacterales bacterium]|nr:thioredoxin family protein [Chthoniobacterales bacterium]